MTKKKVLFFSTPETRVMFGHSITTQDLLQPLLQRTLALLSSLLSTGTDALDPRAALAEVHRRRWAGGSLGMGHICAAFTLRL